VTMSAGGMTPQLSPEINLGVYPGRNRSERAINHILATVPGSRTWPYEQLCTAAFKLSREPNVIDQPVQ
jgi:hypothetical protein